MWVLGLITTAFFGKQSTSIPTFALDILISLLHKLQR